MSVRAGAGRSSLTFGVRRLFLVDTMNFCFWSDEPTLFTVEYQERRWTGYRAMVAALAKAVEARRNYMHARVCVCMCVCACVCVHVCVCMCVCACGCVCMCVCSCVRRLCWRMCVCVDVRMHVCVHVCDLSDVCAHVCACVCMCVGCVYDSLAAGPH